MQSRRTSALSAHRWSQPGTFYFITCCTRFRAAGLSTAPIAPILIDAMRRSDDGGDSVTHAFVVMPDHIHWLLTLGCRLVVGRVVARFKAQTRLTLGAAGLAWQRDFFEHRLRAAEALESYGLYVFLNPYRAGLIAADQPWPHWCCPRPEVFLFMSKLDDGGTPPREWIGQPNPSAIAVGE